MKIKEINFTNHYLFKNMHIDFADDDGNVLDIVILAGVNGSGKSTLLREVYNLFAIKTPVDSSGPFVLFDIEANIMTLPKNISTPLGNVGIEIDYALSNSEMKMIQKSGEMSLIEKLKPEMIPYIFENKLVANSSDELMKQKLIYSPLETSNIVFASNLEYYDYKYQYLNLVNHTVLKDIDTFYMSLLDRFVYQNMKQTPEESIRIISNRINNTFESFDIQTKFIGRKGDGRLPLFQNKFGGIFDINGLSSGEKQLFCKFMSYYMVDPNNAVIMVDEPENSLHPAWQQGIVDMFMGLGNNNQVIIATQSPHVISSAPKESLRFLELTTDPDEPVTVAKWKDFDMNNGMPAERIMREIMGLDSTRSKDMAKSIDDMWNRVKNDDPNNETLKKDFDNLVSILGNTDEDIILMRTQLNLRKNGKKYVINR